MGGRQVVIAVPGCFATLLLALLDQNVVSAVSWTIAFRELQGLGGGGLRSVTMVILAQLVGNRSGEGSSGAGLGGVMVGLGLALGPGFGGLVADHLNWRWVFYINLPLGIAAFMTAALVLRLPVAPVRCRIDYLGAALIAAAREPLTSTAN